MFWCVTLSFCVNLCHGVSLCVIVCHCVLRPSQSLVWFSTRGCVGGPVSVCCPTSLSPEAKQCYGVRLLVLHSLGIILLFRGLHILPPCSQNPFILGPDNINVPNLLAIFAEALKEEALSGSQEVHQRVIAILRHIQVRSGDLV